MSESPVNLDGQKPVDHDAAVHERDEIWDSHWFTQSDHDRIRDLISILPATAESLLDVGCGNGLFVNSLNKLNPANRPRRLYAADRSLNALTHVEVEHCQCNIRELPFSDGEFEIVTCLEVIEHLPLAIYTPALCELSRVAARWIMISVPFEQNLSKSLCECPSCSTLFNSDHHIRSFDQDKLRDLFREHGFAARRMEYLGTSDEYVGYHRIRRLLKGESRNTDGFPPLPHVRILRARCSGGRTRQKASQQRGSSPTPRLLATEKACKSALAEAPTTHLDRSAL